MRPGRWLVVFVLSLVAAAAACSLNPQPFPPDNPDAAGGVADASKYDTDGSASDAGAFADALGDSAPVPQSDGGLDAADASDALLDVSVDAPPDVLGDVALDVSTD